MECIEEKDSSTSYESITSECASATGMNDDLVSEIMTCYGDSPYGSALGNQLMHAIAEKTATLNHNYVPWAVVDGTHTENINDEVTDDLLGYVCKNYTGEKAAACNSLGAASDSIYISAKCFTEAKDIKPTPYEVMMQQTEEVEAFLQ